MRLHFKFILCEPSFWFSIPKFDLVRRAPELVARVNVAETALILSLALSSVLIFAILGGRTMTLDDNRGPDSVSAPTDNLGRDDHNDMITTI